MSGNSWRVETVRVDKIVPNKHQPRKNFDREKLNELGESVRGAGQVELIMVRPINDGRYEIISGHRRFQEQKKNGEKGIAVLIKEGMDEKRSALEAFVSNECRADLEAEEKMNALLKIKELYDFKTDAELAHEVGMNRKTLFNILKLARLDPKVLEKSRGGIFSSATAMELADLDVKKEQIQASEIVDEYKLTRDQTRDLVKAIKNAPEPIKQAILTGEVNPQEAIGIVETLKQQPNPPSKEDVKILVDELKKRTKADEEWKEEKDKDTKDFVEGKKRTKLVHRRNKDEIALDKFEKARNILGFPDPILGITVHILSNIENTQMHTNARKIANDIIIFLTGEMEYDRVNWSGFKHLEDGK